MTETALTFDPVWEALYASGQHLNRYPFNNVPNFFFRHRPRDKSLDSTVVLEVGFGAGNNLWMAAREGARVVGVDAARSGVEFARQRFAEEGLSGDLRVGDFTDLPFPDASVDMAINRQALTQVSHGRARKAVEEIHRCLLPGGVFWSNMFSDRTHHDGRFLGDGLWADITTGKLRSVGQTAFHSRNEVLAMYGPGWEILELIHQECTIFETDEPDGYPYAEWFVIARKRA
jgi:SAM-dependent methyltransferase